MQNDYHQKLNNKSKENAIKVNPFVLWWDSALLESQWQSILRAPDNIKNITII